MNAKASKVALLLDEVDSIINTVKEKEEKYQEQTANVCETYAKSARNLIHYRAFRGHDLRSLQKKLRNLGMSRLANAESHVMASLINTRFLLSKLLDDTSSQRNKTGLSIKNGNKLLVNHTKELLGYRSKGRRVRIMVTQPTEAAYNYALVHDMIRNGMNCARINCAHDGPEVWEKIIQNVHKAAKALGRRVTITMDLAGPKIRTGRITPGAKVRKFAPERDEMGNVVDPALIVFVAELSEDSESNMIPIGANYFQELQVGDRLQLIDTRSKSRRLKIVYRDEHRVHAHCYDTSYIGTGSRMSVIDSPQLEIVVGEMPPIEQALLLRTGDYLTIHKDEKEGEPAQFDEEGKMIRRAHVSCQLSEVFEKIKAGETVLFDDGKIEGIVMKVDSDEFEVRITRAKETGSRLKAEKGINFPTTDLGIGGLTTKDRQDLEFVAKHADVVNFSFVNSKEDVEELFEELEQLEAKNQLSIILKIETQKAFDHLAEILLTAMQVRYVGVMIARGDLAVETGWDNIGRVQREILSLCNAAHIPVIWATQVLENLAKKGLPSRSEITDATNSLKAECVMLNKGPYINDAIGLLDKILGDMEKFDEKNESMLPKLERLQN